MTEAKNYIFKDVFVYKVTYFFVDKKAFKLLNSSVKNISDHSTFWHNNNQSKVNPPNDHWPTKLRH
jgi:hypothetical protein